MIEILKSITNYWFCTKEQLLPTECECISIKKKKNQTNLELKQKDTSTSNNKKILLLAYKQRYEQSLIDAHYAAFSLSPSMLISYVKIDVTKEDKK